jgi:hypothetical protein
MTKIGFDFKGNDSYNECVELVAVVIVGNSTAAIHSGVRKMAEKREMCTCTSCGNEAEMVVTCQLVEVRDTDDTLKKKEKQTRRCTVCGNEADMIVDLEG